MKRTALLYIGVNTRELRMFDESPSHPHGFSYLGKVELDIEEPKRVLVKEVEATLETITNGTKIQTYVFPPGAKNIKPPTYEIEE